MMLPLVSGPSLLEAGSSGPGDGSAWLLLIVVVVVALLLASDDDLPGPQRFRVPVPYA
jgi:hypothetical protein